jgi:hypothetical protein
MKRNKHLNLIVLIIVCSIVVVPNSTYTISSSTGTITPDQNVYYIDTLSTVSYFVGTLKSNIIKIPNVFE